VRLLLEANAPLSTIYFWVDDIDEACKELAASGVDIISPPHMIFKDDSGTFGPAGEGEWMAFFNDPAGNTLAFASRK
jgi:methylmalonyl-CoA/ethylmalonyl-CoA epimerase